MLDNAEDVSGIDIRISMQQIPGSELSVMTSSIPNPGLHSAYRLAQDHPSLRKITWWACHLTMTF